MATINEIKFEVLWRPTGAIATTFVAVEVHGEVVHLTFQMPELSIEPVEQEKITSAINLVVKHVIKHVKDELKLE
jgi:hypothetical protein